MTDTGADDAADTEGDAADTEGDAADAVDAESTEADGERETYVCGACGKEFESEEELETHVHDVGIVD